MTSPDPVWNKGTPMPEDYTCHCGLYVHATRRKAGAVHMTDCPYASQNGQADKLLSVHMAFAKLELLELQAQRRRLTECPGIESVAKAIDAAKGLPTREELLALLREAECPMCEPDDPPPCPWCDKRHKLLKDSK